VPYSPTAWVGIGNRLGLSLVNFRISVSVGGGEEFVNGISAVLKRRVIPYFTGGANVGYRLEFLYFFAKLSLGK
jgi:hypothetical protein